MPQSLRAEFHQQLEQIDKRVDQLFALVAEGLPAATEALLAGDRSVAVAVTERKDAVDNIYRNVETVVDENLALQAPVATELRFLLTVLRVVPELARSHDLVEHIARRGAHGIGNELTPRARGLVDRMGGVGSEMWQDVAQAWHNRDQLAELRLMERDAEMDELHVALIAELASGRVSLPVAMEMALVARFYERLGDHAVNVARRIATLGDGWVQSVGPQA